MSDRHYPGLNDIDASATPEPVVFEAEVTPYRSMSPRGLRLVIGFICAVGFGSTIVFWWLGAWPVAGFNGIDILLASALLRSNGRRQRRRELLMLSGGGLRIVREDGRGGRSEQVLQPAWLRVSLQERPGRVPGLFLSTRNRHVEVASFLGEPEKRDLFEALDSALYRVRNPTFTNPQLCSE